MDASKRTFEEVLREKGMLVYPFQGISMRPMLRQETDKVIIERLPAGRRLQNMTLHCIGHAAANM